MNRLSFFPTLVSATLFALPTAWLFGWSTWGWVLAAALYFAFFWTWLCQEFSILGTASQRDDRCNIELGSSEYIDDFIKHGKALWKGERRIHFFYSDRGGSYAMREVTMHTVVAFDHFFHSTYLIGYCHTLGKKRIFRMDHILEQKLTDETTGEHTTLQNILTMKSEFK